MIVIVIEVSNSFFKSAKKLKKKYPSLTKDLSELTKRLKEEPMSGISLGGKLRKIRMPIASKKSGKSGGARIISYHNILFQNNSGTIILLNIYDKSEKETLNAKEIKELLKINNLL